MRLLIRLRCVESCLYEMQYHYHIQGFVYSLLKDSKYHYIHDKEDYKFFCFSNIFPVTRTLKKNDISTLIISSPDSEFITYLCDRVQSSWKASSIVNIGTMKFCIDSMSKLDLKLPDKLHCTLITGTPIIVRIPRERYQIYDIKPSKNYDYIYWRHEYPIILFLSQVENNLVKKFLQFAKFKDIYWQRIERYEHDQPNLSPSLFQKFKFKKQVATRITIPSKGIKQVVIGTVWEFGFDMNSNRQLIQFALDCGLGERNSLGFGFMNLYD